MKEGSPMCAIAGRLFKHMGLALVTLLSLELFQPPSVATELGSLTTLDEAKLSTRIVLSKCTAVEVRELAGGNIFTFSEFETLRMVKGNLPSTHFTLRLLGGRIGDVEIDAPFTPKFTPGEEVVLFLGPDNVDGYPTISFTGIFKVRTNPVNGKKVVVPTPTGLTLFHTSDNTAYSDSPKLLPLEDFLFSLEKLNQK